jgi:ribosomal protein S12 methylthiotransferase accessory factor
VISRPRFRSHLHVEIIDGDRVFLVAEGRHFVLSGRACVAVANSIDGQRTTDQIVDRLSGELNPTEIYHALLTFEKHGHLEEAFHPGLDLPALSAGTMAYWDALGVEPRRVAERLASQSVALLDCGTDNLDQVRSALERQHIRLTGDVDQADLWLALTNDALHDELAELNRRALGATRPWLLVRPNGLFPWIGPLFSPGTTGCWACLAQRVRANNEVETYLRGLGDAGGHAVSFPPRAALPAVVEAVVELATLEVARWVVLRECASLGKVITLDAQNLHTQEHVLVRQPQCPACGDPQLMARRPAEVQLASRPKTFLADGGHRSASPGEMLARYGHHVSPITGVAKALVRITDPADPLQHVYLAGSNMAVRHDSYHRLRRHVRASCCGKGTTDEQARASGLGEAIERYSGVFRGDEPRLKRSLQSLGDQAIDPRACMLFSDAQYRDRDHWNAMDRRLDAVPLPFDEAARMEWTPLWSLTRQEARYLPSSYCFYSYPTSNERFYCLPDSNGNAAGTSLEDAVLQGFMELVERDAVALWWYNRLRRPAVDLDAVDDSWLQGIRALHQRLGRELWVLDVTSDLGIPAFVALSRRVAPSNGRGEEIVFAPAAHFDARLCLLRAVAELNQMMPGVAPGPDGTGYAYDDPEAVQWWRTATVASQPWLTPREGAVRDPATFPRQWSDDLRTDIETCRAIVEQRGLEMLVLDQTRPDIGMPVVKVVVPGLRHFWARYAPGRLYDVPVSQGWLDRPTLEDDLNPITVFI